MEKNWNYHLSNHQNSNFHFMDESQSQNLKYSNVTVSNMLSDLGWKLSATTIFDVSLRHLPLSYNIFDQVKTQNGNCALFRSNSSFAQETKGSENGFKIYMNIEADYYPSITADEAGKVNKLDFLIPSGVDVFIYDPNLSFVA